MTASVEDNMDMGGNMESSVYNKHTSLKVSELKPALSNFSTAPESENFF